MHGLEQMIRYGEQLDEIGAVLSAFLTPSASDRDDAPVPPTVVSGGLGLLGRVTSTPSVRGLLSGAIRAPTAADVASIQQQVGLNHAFQLS